MLVAYHSLHKEIALKCRTRTVYKLVTPKLHNALSVQLQKLLAFTFILTFAHFILEIPVRRCLIRRRLLYRKIPSSPCNKLDIHFNAIIT